MKFVLGVTLLLALTSLPCAAADAKKIERFAIVIGNNRPLQDDGQPLRFADDDALATAALLREAGVFTSLLVHKDATTRILHPSDEVSGLPRIRDFDRAYRQIVNKVRDAHARGHGAELMFFYSGHGDVEDGEGFLALEDARLTRTKLYDVLAKAGADRNHVVIDACKSYFMAYERGPGGKHVRFAGAVHAAVPARLRNTGFVLSTSSDRESHEWERYNAGILSHEVQSALRGAADANLDGAIDYRELASFLETANLAIKNPRFKPDLMVRAPDDDWKQALLEWPDGHNLWTIGGLGWNHFYLENADGDRLLDAHPVVGQVLHLHIPEHGWPLYVRRNDHTGQRVLTPASPRLIGSPLTTSDEVAARNGGAIGRAYEKLFSAPFGPRQVDHFVVSSLPSVLIDDAHAPRAAPQPPLRIATGVLALTAAIAGASLSAIALGKYLDSANDSQAEVERHNEWVVALNRASIPCYTVAALAAASWAWGPWWTQPSVELTVDSNRRTDGLTVRVRGAF